MKSRDRRALILGGGVIVFAWVALRGAPRALEELDRLEVTTEQRAEVVRRSYARLADLPELNDSFARLQRVADALPRMLLAGDDADAASVDLMERVRTVAEEHPVTLRGFDTRDETATRGPLSLAGVTVTLESDFRGVVDVLSALEKDPGIAIDSVHVTDPLPHGGPGDVEVLVARVAMSGWFWSTEQDGDQSAPLHLSGSTPLPPNDARPERSTVSRAND